MKKIFTLLLLAFPAYLFSQDLTGTWEGSGGGVTYIKMVIKHKGDSIYGYTYDEGGGYCLAAFAARYKSSKKNLVGRGTKILRNSGSHVLADYDLNYSRNERGEFLTEADLSFLEKVLQETPLRLKKISNKTAMPGPPNKPVVKQVPKPPVTKPAAKPKPSNPVTVKPPVKLPVKKPENPVVSKPVSPPVVVKPSATVPRVAQPAPIIKPAPTAVLKRKDERASKLVEKIYTSADTIRVMVYDNGEVDGDTVTVFFDNAVILDRYRISDRAKEIRLPISQSGQHEIELFANNLGTIPPNTALIIITAAGKRYELRASYDLHTNAKIIIQYKQ